MEETKAAPRAMGSPAEAYREVLSRLASSSAKKVLDAPAGRGALSRLLLDHGYEVAASDIVPEIFEVEGIECRASNLNERLPYEEASFDAVASCNGLHRVYAVGRAISEYARVLRPGGLLLVTLPNFTKLTRRLRFLFTGVVSWAAVRSGKESEEPEAHFRNPVGLPQILLAMKEAGLELRGIRGIHKHRGRLLGLPLFLLIRLGLFFVPERRRKEYWLMETASFPALSGDFVFLEAEKPRSDQ